MALLRRSSRLFHDHLRGLLTALERSVADHFTVLNGSLGLDVAAYRAPPDSSGCFFSSSHGTTLVHSAHKCTSLHSRAGTVQARVPVGTGVWFPYEIAANIRSRMLWLAWMLATVPFLNNTVMLATGEVSSRSSTAAAGDEVTVSVSTATGVFTS